MVRDLPSGMEGLPSGHLLAGLVMGQAVSTGGEGLVRLADGAALWTTVSGIGPPVVCCHGGPGLWDYLEPLASLIDDVFTVVRSD